MGVVSCDMDFLCFSMSFQSSIFKTFSSIFLKQLKWHIVKENRWVVLSIYNIFVIYIARCCYFSVDSVFGSENHQLLLFAGNLDE